MPYILCAGERDIALEGASRTTNDRRVLKAVRYRRVLFRVNSNYSGILQYEAAQSKVVFTRTSMRRDHQRSRRFLYARRQRARVV